MTKTEWIAVDWGTSHLRVWVFGADNVLIAKDSSADGMATLSPDGFEPALLALIGEFLTEGGKLPVIACGMVGAAQGWLEASYLATPCPPPNTNLAVMPTVLDPRLDVHILPGVKQAKPTDVMRGEETQIAGYLASNPDFDGVLCLPGTHTKWVHISAGEIVSFQTFMTGEMFALLSKHSVLHFSVGSPDWDDDSFAVALDDAISRPQTLASDLFRIRAAGLLDGLSKASAKARLSGLLIGLELVGARPYWLGQRVVMIGSEGLTDLYKTALETQGGLVETTDAMTMTLLGLRAAYKNLKEAA